MSKRIVRCIEEPQQAIAVLLILLARLGVRPAEKLTTQMSDAVYAYGWKTGPFCKRRGKKTLHT